ncbi:glutamate--tRNA ligase [Bacteroidota bacterium]
MQVRVRFAPSPTGYLHVGGLRTAHYNYLFAKHNNGKIILRIEDTDRTRLVENATENLIESLSWAGIEFDEGPVQGGDYGPYVQSERLKIYKKYADELINNGKAYYAFDTSEEIDAMRKRLQAEKKDPKYVRDSMRNQLTLGDDETRRILDNGEPFVIRLKVPSEGEVRFKDIIRGEVAVPCKDIDDQVLLKSDGFPTYHLANVVDDYLMEISHVIRGEEWLPSTPKHVLLYDSFGWELPQFAHLPLLLNKDKSKLSKRQGSVAVEDFRVQGYLKDAFVNFIALLGWNPTGDREIYSIQEFIEFFNLEKVNKGGAVFDTQKLEWMNAQYLRNIPIPELADMLEPELKSKGFEESCKEYNEQVVRLFIERVNFIQEIPDMANYMFEDPKEYEENFMNKQWKSDSIEIVKPFLEVLKGSEDFSHDKLYEDSKAYCEEKDIKLKILAQLLRLMVTGKAAGAGMFETMEVLGKDFVINRIESFLNKKEKGIL